MSGRRTAVALAVAAVAGAVALVADRRSLAAPEVAVGVLAAAAVLLATWVALRRSRVALDPGEATTPERGPAAAVPGDEFDDRLESERGRPLDRSSFTRDRIRERVRTVARSILVARGGLTAAAAEDRLSTGDWTDDRVAAAFLRGETPAVGLAGRLRGTDGFVRGVRRSVAALAAFVGAPAPPRDAGGERSQVRSWWADLVETTGDAPTLERPAVGDVRRRATRHWTGIGALALSGVGVGLVADAPGVVLAGALGVGYLAFARTGGVDPTAVALERSVDDPTPAPGERVTVTVTVRNEGEAVLPSVRVVDGVPDPLAVVDGAPRHATALAPGAAATFSYDLRARRGVHAFDPATVRVRNAADSVAAATAVDAGGTVTCRLRPTAPDRPALGGDRGRFVGTVPTATGGPGVEFHSTRAYRRGDPVSRIDWNRLARSGDLTTVDYRRDRATTVVLVVDARAAARVAPAPDAESALERSVAAAGHLAATLLDAGNRVGLAAFGPTPLWVAPAATRVTEYRIRSALTDHPAVAPGAPDGETYTGDWVDEFRARVDGGAVVLCSPLVDDAPTSLVERLRRAGYDVTVVSPDPTATDSVGRALAALERRVRLSDLRTDGARVVDWDRETPLPAALDRARRRWSR